MTLASIRLAGQPHLDPAISEAFHQQSAGYLDLARIALRACGAGSGGGPRHHGLHTTAAMATAAGCCSSSGGTTASPHSASLRSGTSAQSAAQQFRVTGVGASHYNAPVITLANSAYAVARTYPSILIVPSVSLELI